MFLSSPSPSLLALCSRAKLLLLAAAVASACSPADATDRGPLGKADNIGSCADACGMQSEGSCFCDEQCAEVGDCCDDYEAVCTADDTALFSCDRRDGLFAATQILADGGDCADWVDAEYGRVLHTGASGSIVSRRNEFGLGLLVSAAHTRGEGFFGEPGSNIPVFLEPAIERSAVSYARLTSDDATGPRELFNGVFGLFSPAIPAAESGNSLKNILPRNDFFLSIVDTQQLQSNLGQLQGELVRDPLEIRDPLALTTTAPTWTTPSVGDELMYMGYPREGDVAGKLAVGFSTILSDAEAEAVIDGLAAIGDEEGTIPYDPDVEFLFATHAEPGNSGGPAFDADGRQIGVLVRASTTPLDGVRYARAVRMSFIFAQLEAELETLDSAKRAEIAPFLELGDASNL